MHLPVLTGSGRWAARSEVLLDELCGNAVAGFTGVRPAGEDGGDDFAVLVHGGSTGVAGTNVDAEAGYGALHRTAIVRVGGDYAPRLPRASRPDVERPVLRETQNSDRLAGLRICERQGGRAQSF